MSDDNLCNKKYVALLKEAKASKPVLITDRSEVPPSV